MEHCLGIQHTNFPDFCGTFWVFVFIKSTKNYFKMLREFTCSCQDKWIQGEY